MFKAIANLFKSNDQNKEHTRSKTHTVGTGDAVGHDQQVGLARLALLQRQAPAPAPVLAPTWISHLNAPREPGFYSVTFKGDTRVFPARWNGQLWTDLDNVPLVVQDLRFLSK